MQFEKPGRKDDFDYPEMAKEAGLNFNAYLSKLDMLTIKQKMNQ